MRLKKLLSLLIAITMIASAIPVVSFAESGDKVACWTLGNLNTSRARAYLSDVTAGQKISFFVRYAVTDSTIYSKMSMYVRCDGSGSKSAYYAPGLDNGGKKVYSGQYIPSNAVACEDDWYYIECLTYYDGTYDLFVDRDGSVITDAQIADLRVDGVAVDESRVSTAVREDDIVRPVITGELPVWPGEEPAATSLEITSSFSGYIGQKTRIEYEFYPSKAKPESITWSSSNDRVVTVDNYGEVTLVSEGEATVTAISENGLTASCKLTVKDRVQLFLDQTVTVGGDYYNYGYGGTTATRLCKNVCK